MRILPVVVLIGITCPINLDAQPKSDAVTLARTALEQLAKGEFGAVVATFDDKVREALPEEKLRATWQSVQSQFGALQRTGEPRITTKGDFRIVTIPGHFEHADLDLTFVYSPEGRIAGLNIRPASTPSSTYVDAAYVNPSNFTEREVTVDAGGWALPGTLSVPNGKGPFPAVVLVHGSGPQDRDETLGPNKPFRDLARGLASRGVAALRYEKRTRQHQAKSSAASSITVKDEVVDDAVAAVRVLRETPAIDPKQVFVAGHSLGGMLAPRIAAAAGSDVAGLIILAGAVRSLEQSVLDQTRYLANADGTVSPEEQKQIDAAAAVVERVKSLESTDAAVSVLGASVPASYLVDLRGYNPPAAAASLKLPMLILQGGRDYQVTTDDFAKWKSALGDRQNVTLKLYPQLNHLFMPGKGPSVPAEYLAAGHVAEEVVEDIATWIRSAAR
jgi:dienelactone hydrolase